MGEEPFSACVLNEDGRPAAPCGSGTNARAMVYKWLPPESSVLEIGARYGGVSCAIAHKQRQSGQVVAVEPDPVVWQALANNLATYGCNVKVVQGVVGKEDV